jgi:hydroxyacylglutathione hydrolase
MNTHFKILSFVSKHEPENINLQNKISKINEKLKNNLPTIPSSVKDEIECNIFLRAKNLESFSKLRDLKDNF